MEGRPVAGMGVGVANSVRGDGRAGSVMSASFDAGPRARPAFRRKAPQNGATRRIFPQIAAADRKASPIHTFGPI